MYIYIYICSGHPLLHALTYAAVIRYIYIYIYIYILSSHVLALNSSAPALTVPFVLPRTHSCPPSHYPPISPYPAIPLSPSQAFLGWTQAFLGWTHISSLRRSGGGDIKSGISAAIS